MMTNIFNTKGNVNEFNHWAATGHCLNVMDIAMCELRSFSQFSPFCPSVGPSGQVAYYCTLQTSFATENGQLAFMFHLCMAWWLKNIFYFAYWIDRPTCNMLYYVDIMSTTEDCRLNGVAKMLERTQKKKNKHTNNTT